jgi:carboxylesterase type B
MNYVFDTIGSVYGQDPGAVANWTTEDYQLGDRMSNLWANFIKTQNPNAGNLTGWSASLPNSTTVRQIGQNMTTISLVDNSAKISLIEEWYAQATRVY